MHSITSKLNKSAREHANEKGVTFFVDLGEKNYNFKSSENEYTNYSAALFAKDNQIDFYRSVLVEGAVIEVSGTGVIIEMPSDPQYKPKLMIQNAQLGYTFSPNSSAPQQHTPQQAPQRPAPAYQPPAPQATDIERSWIDAVKANPNAINDPQIATNPQFKARIQQLIQQGA